MVSPGPFHVQRAGLEAFLLAEIGTEPSGMPLTVPRCWRAVAKTLGRRPATSQRCADQLPRMNWLGSSSKAKREPAVSRRPRPLPRGWFRCCRRKPMLPTLPEN